MTQRLRHQEPHPPEHESHEELAIIVTLEETIAGTALDKRLRREQTEAILELINAHVSRVHSVPPPTEDEKPRD